MFCTLFGKPVVYPSDKEIRDHDRSYEDIIARASALSAGDDKKCIEDIDRDDESSDDSVDDLEISAYFQQLEVTGSGDKKKKSAAAKFKVIKKIEKKKSSHKEKETQLEKQKDKNTKKSETDKNETHATEECSTDDERRFTLRNASPLKAIKGSANAEIESLIDDAMGHSEDNEKQKLEDHINRLASSIQVRKMSEEQVVWILTKNYDYMLSVLHVAPTVMFEEWLKEGVKKNVSFDQQVTAFHIMSCMS